MTRRDTWRAEDVRPTVRRWREFRDAVQRHRITVQDGDRIVFVLPMPASWSAKKRAAHLGQPHRQKPDLDNLLGGLFDAAMPKGDAHIASLRAVEKRWGQTGVIEIDRMDP